MVKNWRKVGITGKRHQKRRELFYFFLIQVKTSTSTYENTNELYTYFKNKTWNIHRKFRGYLFILGKNKKWKNNFRECSAKLYGNFTQHPGPLFWFRVCWDLIAVEQAEFSRKAPMLGYLLIFYILAKERNVVFLLKNLSLWCTFD